MAAQRRRTQTLAAAVAAAGGRVALFTDNLSGASDPATDILLAGGQGPGGAGNGGEGTFHLGAFEPVARPPEAPLPPIDLVAAGAVWRYLDNGSNQGAAWREANFNDSLWAQGPAQLGYGEGDEETVVSFGSSGASNKLATTYFRHTFAVEDASLVQLLTTQLLRDECGRRVLKRHGGLSRRAICRPRRHLAV